MEYTDYDLQVRISFKSPEMDLREIGIVSTGLHAAFNEGFAQALEIPSLIGGRRYFSEHEDSLLISLVVTNLEYGSFSADTKAKIHRALRDLSIGAAGSLVASTLWAIGASADGPAIVDRPDPPSVDTTIDVGDNVQRMIEKLSATGKPWELTVEDAKTGFKVTIRSRD